MYVLIAHTYIIIYVYINIICSIIYVYIIIKSRIILDIIFRNILFSLNMDIFPYQYIKIKRENIWFIHAFIHLLTHSTNILFEVV